MTTTTFHGGRVILHGGDMLAVLDAMPENSVDSLVTDPPYHLTSIVKRFGGENAAPAQHGTDGLYARGSAGFMGKSWDGGDIAFRPGTWAKVMRVLKPGGHLVAFAATKNSHRMVCAIEDAGFEIRDALQWIYGSGFPKSLDVSKAIVKTLGAKRDQTAPRSVIAHQRNAGNRRPYMDDPTHTTDGDVPATAAAAAWEGWGTALKPAFEPICLARKPLSEKTVAANVLRWGTGAINIDGCRVHSPDSTGGAYTVTRRKPGATMNAEGGNYRPQGDDVELFHGETKPGRWPANILHDGSDEVVSAFPTSKDGVAGKRSGTSTIAAAGLKGYDKEWGGYGGEGSAARFFYSSKASASDRVPAGEHRAGAAHPTVKPIALMRWLVRLITPPGGTTLDCFAGTGTTGEAAVLEGFRAVLIEREPDYQLDIAERMRRMTSIPEAVAATTPAISTPVVSSDTRDRARQIPALGLFAPAPAAFPTPATRGLFG